MSMSCYLAYSQKYSDASMGTRRWRQVYLVSGMARSDDPVTCPGLPTLGGLTADANFACIELAGETDPEDETLARVAATYAQSPVKLPIEVSVFTSHKTVSCWKDVYGYWIVGAAGDPYSPPLEDDAPLIRIEVVRRRSNGEFFPADITKYVNHVNSKPFSFYYKDGNGNKIYWQPFPTGSMLCSDIRAIEVREPYYHKLVTYCFEMEKEDWKRRIPNIGPRCRDPKTKELVLPKTFAGLPFRGQALLNPDGTQWLPPENWNGSTIDFPQHEPIAIKGVADFGQLYLFDGVAAPS